jgi:hypothetical protein
MEKTFKPLAKKDNIVVQNAENEVLVYDLNTNQAHCLNSTAAFVWQSCDGKNSVDAISTALAEKSGKQVPQEVVWMAIEQLQEKDLVETFAVPAGTSRREAIKKAGLAAMIALPIVASLAAPKSVMASTSCICNTLADCSPQPGCPTASCAGGVCSNVGPV